MKEATETPNKQRGDVTDRVILHLLGNLVYSAAHERFNLSTLSVANIVKTPKTHLHKFLNINSTGFSLFLLAAVLSV